MKDEEIKESLNNLFNRAIIAVSYSAANRIIVYVSAHGLIINPVFVIFTISLTSVFIILNSGLLRVAGVQTSLSILLSKLLTSVLPLPEEQKGYFILPSVFFYLILCSCICSFIHNIVENSKIIAELWDRISPFIVLFSSSIIIQIITKNNNLQLLYLISICYLTIVQYFYCSWNKIDDVKNRNYYFFMFVDSIMCRALVLFIQDFVKSKIDNKDIAVVVFNVFIVVMLYSIVLMNTKIQVATQVHYTLGVLIFTISQQLFTILQKFCDNEIVQTFFITTTVMAILLYNRHLGSPLYNICVNCLALSWTLLIEVWISSFHSAFEPFIVYFIIFIVIQKMQESALRVFDFTEGLFQTPKDILYGYEMIMIAHDTSSSIGLPSSVHVS